MMGLPYEQLAAALGQRRSAVLYSKSPIKPPMRLRRHAQQKNCEWDGFCRDALTRPPRALRNHLGYPSSVMNAYVASTSLGIRYRAGQGAIISDRPPSTGSRSPTKTRQSWP